MINSTFETIYYSNGNIMYAGNVLNIQFPNHTVIVINLQTPLHELWLATKEGGFHFRWAGSKVKPKWQDTKTQEDFFAVVASHITKQGGIPFNLTGLA
jgi:CyaY protein